MIIGIDLGTTNSAVAVWRGDTAEIIPNSLGHRLTPSAVSVDEKTGEVIVGLAARERQSSHAGQTATAFKRYMGSQRVTELGRQKFLPEELSALVLRQLKADAETYLGELVTEAVITVPAYFNDKQRKATRRAGELAGLKVERLLNEPTAAALAYGIHERDREAQFLVFDLGGGTFDVSVLEIFEGVIEVRASTGDNRLGGEDFNDILIESMRRAHAKDWGAQWGEDKELHERLRAAAERTRRELTGAPGSVMRVVWKDRVFEHEVTAEAFETACEPLMARLREPVLRALRDSRLKADALDEIVLVGGATRMPIVRKAVTKMFGRFPANAVNPDEAVAFGAAVQAGLKSRDIALKELVLTDVCPYTLGIETAERGADGKHRSGVFTPIIERNTTVPCSRVKPFSPVDAEQRRGLVNIYQGESRWVAENIRLGSLEIALPSSARGGVHIECRFTYDINGLLEVDVHVPQTGEKRQLVIVDDDNISADEVKSRREALEKLKVHPRDEDANRAALARAGRCYEDFIGDRREYVAHLITTFEAVLDRQDPRAAEPARRSLLEALDALEGETWL